MGLADVPRVAGASGNIADCSRISFIVSTLIVNL